MGVGKPATGLPGQAVNGFDGLMSDIFGESAFGFQVCPAGCGGNGKAEGDRQAEITHFGKVAPLSAEKVAHMSTALSKKIYPFFGHSASFGIDDDI